MIRHTHALSAHVCAVSRQDDEASLSRYRKTYPHYINETLIDEYMCNLVSADDIKIAGYCYVTSERFLFSGEAFRITTKVRSFPRAEGAPLCALPVCMLTLQLDIPFVHIASLALGLCAK